MEKPAIFNLETKSLSDIKREYKINQIIDTYKELLEDLFLVRNPKYKFENNYQKEFNNFLKEHSRGKSLEFCGNWVFFPWSKTLVHYLENDSHQEVRTARNKNLILPNEQKKFYNFKVGVTGLSVGSHGALTTALMGGGKLMKLADPDTISPTNLNRMRFDFTQVGMNKAELVAQYIYQLDPYSDIHIYSEGINEKNLGKFLDGLDILIEELDDIEIKFKIRQEAKKRKIPVVMVTDNGDNVIVDVERFDLDPDLPIFYGNLDGLDLKKIKESPKKLFEAMAKIIDVSLVPPRVLNSVMEVGKTIYSWPQLASAATLSGVVIAYIIRKIALGEQIKEGKYEVNLESAIDPDYDNKKDSRIKSAQNFLKSINNDKT